MSDLRARDVAEALALLVPGAEVEASASQDALFDQLVATGLVVTATASDASRDALVARQKALAELRTGDPKATALREEILDLSEELATLDGAAFVGTGGGGGAYRGAMPARRRGLALTHAGRTLLSRLGPRASRLKDETLDDFSRQLSALEALFRMRSERAGKLVSRVGHRASTIEPYVLRSAMLGLASMPQDVDALGDAFVLAFSALRDARAGEPYSVAQDTAAAESLLLHQGSTAIAYDAPVMQAHAAWRSDLARTHCQGRTDDALDAMLLLSAAPPDERDERITNAARFAKTMARAKVPTPLSLALLATSGGVPDDLVPRTTSAYRALAAEDPLEGLTAAVLIAIQRAFSVETQLARIEMLQRGLAPLSWPGTRVAAAVLALLDGDEDGVIEDLRLATRAVQRALGSGGAESTSLGLKLLMSTALLARGTEGDPEEAVALALRALPDVAALDLGMQGLGTVSATLPLLPVSVAVFHRPMLDAAALYDAAKQ